MNRLLAVLIIAGSFLAAGEALARRAPQSLPAGKCFKGRSGAVKAFGSWGRAKIVRKSKAEAKKLALERAEARARKDAVRYCARNWKNAKPKEAAEIKVWLAGGKCYRTSSRKKWRCRGRAKWKFNCCAPLLTNKLLPKGLLEEL